MSDFRLRVIAETQAALRGLQQVDRVADRATRERRLQLDLSGAQRSFKNLQRDVETAANGIKQFYSISKNIPGLGARIKDVENLTKRTVSLAREVPNATGALAESAKAGNLLSSSFQAAGASAEQLVNRLARVGFSLYAVKQASGLLQSAFGSLFNETLGREIQFRETVLKAQTTLASTNRVFIGEKEITDPYEKVKALTGDIEKRVANIRDRTLELAGLTSNEVVEVFGVVASKIGMIGGSLQDAEDLAVNFAGALAVFNMPIYQARQEIGSILMGNITRDSYIAQQLGITNEDVAKARTQVGGIVKFLEERLAAAMAGEKIMAQGFAGVTSNLMDLWELVTQRFGAGLLDPLLAGLNQVFDFLFKIRTQVLGISEALGKGLGSTLSSQLGGIFRTSSVFSSAGAGAEDFLSSLEKRVTAGAANLQTRLEVFTAPLRTLFEELAKSIAALTAGLAQLAEGFVSISIENLRGALQIIANLSPVVTSTAAAFGQLLRVYGELLKVPMVQYLSSVGTQFKLLESIGVMNIAKLVIGASALKAAWGPIVAFFKGLIARVTAIVGAGITAVGVLLTKAAGLFSTFAASIDTTNPALARLRVQLTALSASLEKTGTTAAKTGTQIRSVGGAATAAGSKVTQAIKGFIALNLKLFALQAAIAIVVDAFGRFQAAQDKAVANKRAEAALQDLRTIYKNVGDNADEATKRAKAFAESLVDARFNEALQTLEKVRETLQRITELGDPADRSIGMALRRAASVFNPSNWGAVLEAGRTGENWQAVRARQLRRELQEAEEERDRWAREINEKSAADQARLEMQNQDRVVREVTELKRQQENELFQLRQQLAQREVDIFRAAGELRIFQQEQANKKLIEGEEGASRVALEALNNYLSTRERGELDIEAAKQQMVIESANVEKQIADYRLENEKRIAELRARAGQFDMDVADYQRDSAEAAARQPTGNVQAGPSGALDFGVIKALALQAGFNENQATVMTAIAMAESSGRPRAHNRNAATGDNSYGLWQINMLGDMGAERRRQFGISRNEDLFDPQINAMAARKVHQSQGWNAWSVYRDGAHRPYMRAARAAVPADLSTAMGARAPESETPASSSAPTRPEATDLASIGAPAVEAYSTAVRQLNSAMERLRSLQAALSDARTAAAFEEIARAAFPEVQLESYEDELIQLDTTMKALAATADEAYDPERMRIAVDMQTRLAIQAREAEEIMAAARNRAEITEEELLRLQEQLNERHARFVDQVKEEARLRQRNLTVTRQLQTIEAMRAERNAIPFNLSRAQLQATTQMSAAFLGDDPVRRRQLDAEVRIAERLIDLRERGIELDEQGQEEHARLSMAIRASAQILGEMDQAVIDFQESLGRVREGARTISDGFKGFAKSTLTGGDLVEATNQMLETTTGRFLDMFLDAAFKPFEDYLVSEFKKIFNIQDPTQQLQLENTNAILSNTAALNTLTTALSVPGGAATGPVSLAVIPAGTPESVELGAATLEAANGIRAYTASLPQLDEATGALREAAGMASQGLQGVGTQATQTQGLFSNLMQNMGGAITALGGIAMGFAGVQQMGQGGTYNTLMGLAGIFGAVSGIAGGIGSIGGLFSGGAAAASSIGANFTPASTLSSVGSFNPVSTNFLPSFAGGGYTGSGPMAGGLDGRGGFMAMLHPNETVVPGNPYAATASYLETATSRNFTSGRNEPIRVETTMINQVEYATVTQLQEATQAAERRGAERGRGAALRDMQYSVRTRKRTGLG